MAQDFRHDRASRCVSDNTITSTTPDDHLEPITLTDMDVGSAFVVESTVDGTVMDCSSTMEVPVKPVPSSVTVPGKIASEDELRDVEIGDFFLEDAASNEALPPEVLELQKKEKLRELYSEKNLEKLDGIWKKVLISEM